jgi:hypothetical protein
VNDNGPSDDRVLAEKRDVLVGDIEVGDTVAIGLNVAEITYVTLSGIWSTVLGASGLQALCTRRSQFMRPGAKWGSRMTHVEVRTGGSAAVGSITELTGNRSLAHWLHSVSKAKNGALDMEASLSVGVVSSDFARDSDWRILVTLCEAYNTIHL